MRNGRGKTAWAGVARGATANGIACGADVARVVAESSRKSAAGEGRVKRPGRNESSKMLIR